jgi:hypothetical protein
MKSNEMGKENTLLHKSVLTFKGGNFSSRRGKTRDLGCGPFRVAGH